MFRFLGTSLFHFTQFHFHIWQFACKFSPCSSTRDHGVQVPCHEVQGRAGLTMGCPGSLRIPTRLEMDLHPAKKPGHFEFTNFHLKRFVRYLGFAYGAGMYVAVMSLLSEHQNINDETKHRTSKLRVLELDEILLF